MYLSKLTVVVASCLCMSSAVLGHAHDNAGASEEQIRILNEKWGTDVCSHLLLEL